MTRKTARSLAAVAFAAAVLAGCGTQAATSGSASTSKEATPKDSGSEPTHSMADGSSMSDAEMAQMDSADSETANAPGQVTHRGDGPSAAAGMICSREIAEAVQRTFRLPAPAEATDRWSDQTYTCTYRLPTSTFTLSVKDLDQAAPGRAHFDSVAASLPGAERIRGLENLGFPAVQTPPSTGQVLFLKDDKTLQVDAGEVATRDLPPDYSRTDTAYSIASAVIACWTE